MREDVNVTSCGIRAVSVDFGCLAPCARIFSNQVNLILHHSESSSEEEAETYPLKVLIFSLMISSSLSIYRLSILKNNKRDPSFLTKFGFSTFCTRTTFL